MKRASIAIAPDGIITHHVSAPAAWKGRIFAVVARGFYTSDRPPSVRYLDWSIIHLPTGGAYMFQQQHGWSLIQLISIARQLDLFADLATYEEADQEKHHAIAAEIINRMQFSRGKA